MEGEMQVANVKQTWQGEAVVSENGAEIRAENSYLQLTGFLERRCLEAAWRAIEKEE